MGIPFVLAKRMKLTSIIRDDRVKWITLSGLMLLTVALHYGLMDLFFGHAAWTHAIHSRFCYIPIAVAASWFGIRGGLVSAATISFDAAQNVAAKLSLAPGRIKLAACEV